MSSRPARSRVVGALSIAYGVLLGLFWAWVLWDRETQGSGDLGRTAFQVVLWVAAPVLLVIAGYGMYSTRIAGPDARALKVATIVVLAVKAAEAGYRAVGLIAHTGAFSGLASSLGLRLLAVEVVPSGVWALVLALTSVPTADPPAPEKPLA